MVQQRHKPTTRSLAASENGSEGDSSNKDCDQVYCVVLHVAEAINFVGRDATEQREKIMMNAALNTVDFDVEGTNSATTEAIVFNSNCIWECDLVGIKRIKTDHRPVKLTFSACRGGGLERKTIGSLLLPLRGLPVLSTTGSQNAPHLKTIWHKLICISSEFRSQKPEVLLTLAIIKKSILHTKDFDHLMQFAEEKAPPSPPLKSPGHSITASMLQSQANIYVQSLMQLGLLQVGNDPLIDCDIIEVVLQLKQLKKVNRLVKWLNQGKDPGSVVVMFDFVGNVTNIELKLNESDSYAVNDVLGLRFKTSLRSMRLYFQRIFYLPFNMYMNGTAIANYRMDFNHLLPPDSHFSEKLAYSSNGSFTFNRIGRQDSARDPKPPVMEYSFSVEIKNINSRQEQVEPEPASSIASGVIRNRTDTEAISLSHGHHDAASMTSLNVGAELSASEGSRGSASTMDDGNDFDAPGDLSKTQSKRRKFTRLKGEELHLESEDEPCLGKKFSKEKPKAAAQEKKVEILVTDSFEETEEHFYSRKGLDSSEEIIEARAARSFKMQSASEESLPSKKLKMKAKGSKEALVKSSQLGLKAPKNVKIPLEDHEYLSEVTSLQQFEMEERKLADEDELKSTKRRRIKSGQTHIHTKSPMEEHEHLSKVTSLQQFEQEERRIADEDKLEATRMRRIKSGHNLKNTKLQIEDHEYESVSDVTSLPQFDGEERLQESMNSQRVKVASKEHLPAAIEQKVRKSKKVSREMQLHENNPSIEDEALNASSRESIPETKVRKKYVKKVSKTELREEISLPQERSFSEKHPEVIDISEETFDISEESFDNQQKTSSKEKLCKKARTTKVVKKIGSIESVLEPDFTDQEVRSKRKVKSKTCVPEDLQDISTSTQEIGMPKTSKADLALRARWVEVNKTQSAALEETELFLEETCQAELHEIFYEDQLALGLAKPLKPKNKLRTAKEAEVKNVDSSQSQGDRLRKKKRTLPAKDHVPQAEFKSSEECISLPESPSISVEVIRDPEIEAREVRVLKKKKVKKVLVEEEPLEGPNESLEEQAVKPIKRKVIRKKSSVIIKNKEHAENVEPQEELVTFQTKKITKKSKPVADKPTEDDVKATKKNSSRISVKSSSSRKTPRDLTSLDDFEMDHSADTETVGQRIKSWRRQEIERFEEELARKELHYKAQLEEMEYQELRILQQNQEDPDEAESEGDKSVDYQTKFNELEQHILQLQAEMEQQVMLFESRSVELREENLQLANEKAELKARIATMEQQIIQLRTQGSDEAELKEVLGELRSQNSRYFHLARQKDRYKKQWRRCARRVHALKLAMYERNTESQLQGNSIDLREILTKDALEFEREYGQFRRSGQSVGFPLGSLSGSGDGVFMPNLSMPQSVSHDVSQDVSQDVFYDISQSNSHTISQSVSQDISQTISESN